MKFLSFFYLFFLTLICFNSVVASSGGWPECLAPQDLEVVGENENQFMIQWKGDLPSYDDIRYELKVVYENGTTYEDIIYKGLNYLIPKNEGGSIKISLRTLCDGKGTDFVKHSDWESLNYLTTNYQRSEVNYETLELCESNFCDIRELLGKLNYNPETGILTFHNPIKSDTIIFRYSFGDHGAIMYAEITPENRTFTINITPEQMTYFSAQFTTIHTPCAGCTPCICEWNDIVFEDDDIKPFPCGNHPPEPDLTSKAVQSLSVGSQFLAYNFPVIITQLTNQSTGRGILMIPFRENPLQVSFSGLKVNTSNVMIEGDVSGVLGSFSKNDMINDTIEIGQEICLPPPIEPGWDKNGLYQPGNKPYDGNGFGQNGRYNIPPYNDSSIYDTNYDPNGFDKNGNHVSTGSPFNENGCNRLGVDSLGNACDPKGKEPYYWMTSEDEIYATEFWDSLSPLVSPKVNHFLDSIANHYIDSLQFYEKEFTSKQKLVYQYLSHTGIDAEYVLGPDSVFAKKGMTKKMTERPRDFITEVSNNYKQLNKNHQELYDLDKKLIEVSTLKDGVDTLRLTNKEVFIIQQLEFIIKNKDKDEIDKLKKPDYFKSWLETYLISKCMESLGYYDNTQYKSTTPKIHNFFEQKTYDSYDPYFSLASNENFHTNHSLELKKEVDYIKFALQNDYKFINGLHRAFYLEKIVGQSKMLLNQEAENLPITISKVNYGVTYTILISRIDIKPNSATLDAFLILDEPNSGKRLVFEAENIKFSPGGLLNEEASKLKLKSNVGFRISNAMKAYVIGKNDQTYIAWDCNGVQEVSADIDVEVCRNYLVPIDTVSNTVLPDEKRVKFDVVMKGKGWGEYYGSVTIDPFAVAGYEDITWTVQDVKFDFSTRVSPSTFSDTLYSTAFVSKGRPSPYWKGLYINKLSSTLPNSFQKNSGPITVGVKRVIFDENGFSGKVFAEKNILSLEDGNLDGWAFSIDKFFLQFRFNALMGGGLNGNIHVPLVKNSKKSSIVEEDCFRYEGALTKEGGFKLTVKPTSEVKMPLWLATTQLHANSEITVKKHESKYAVFAKLHGNITIGGELQSNLNISLGELSFQNLLLSNTKPYLHPGVWSTPGNVGANFGGFGLNLKVPTPISKPDNKVGLNFGIYLNLAVGEGISAGTDFELIGRMETNAKGLQIWKYDSYLMNEIYLKANIKGVVDLEGSISFFKNNPTYGNGFKGVLNMKVLPLNGVGVAAVGLFGTTNFNHNSNYKYFMADALANLGPGIDIYPSTKLLGFGGGIYYHMKRTGNPILPANITDMKNTVLPETTGASLSGVVYEPDFTSYFGLKSTVGIGFVHKNTVNANLAFEVSFFKNDQGKLGGIDKVYLDGCAKFMSEFDIGQIPTKSIPGVPPNLKFDVDVKANMHVELNFIERSLDGNLEVFFNTPFIRGGMDEYGKMAMAEFRVSSEEYYLNVGRPDKPCRIKATLPIIGDLLEYKGYLDIGTNIPPLADLPVSLAKYNNKFRIDEALRKSGSGFAFGLGISIPEKKFALSSNNDFVPEGLRASISLSAKLDLGLDMMIQNYGDLSCGGYSPIGINGWYGMGNMFGHVSGKLLVNEEPLFYLSASTILQAKLPNPNIINGIFDFEFKYGILDVKYEYEFASPNNCTFQGTTSPLDGKKYIAGSNPFDGDEQVNVSINPIIDFNYPMNQEIQVKDVNGAEIRYRIEMTDVTGLAPYKSDKIILIYNNTQKA